MYLVSQILTFLLTKKLPATASPWVKLSMQLASRLRYPLVCHKQNQKGRYLRLCSHLFAQSLSLVQLLTHFSIHPSILDVLVLNTTLIFTARFCRLCCLEDFHESAQCPFLSDASAFTQKAESDCICRGKKHKQYACVCLFF